MNFFQAGSSSASVEQQEAASGTAAMSTHNKLSLSDSTDSLQRGLKRSATCSETHFRMFDSGTAASSGDKLNAVPAALKKSPDSVAAFFDDAAFPADVAACFGSKTGVADSAPCAVFDTYTDFVYVNSSRSSTNSPFAVAGTKSTVCSSSAAVPGADGSIQEQFRAAMRSAVIDLVDLTSDGEEEALLPEKSSGKAFTNPTVPVKQASIFVNSKPSVSVCFCSCSWSVINVSIFSFCRRR